MSKLPSRNILLIYIHLPQHWVSLIFANQIEYKLSYLGLHLFDLQNIQHFFYVK